MHHLSLTETPIRKDTKREEEDKSKRKVDRKEKKLNNIKKGKLVIYLTFSKKSTIQYSSLITMLNIIKMKQSWNTEAVTEARSKITQSHRVRTV